MHLSDPLAELRVFDPREHMLSGIAGLGRARARATTVNDLHESITG